MADILKLKKKAADFEAKKQMDKALATYREMIELYESGEEDPIDIPLYNRVGDLLQKAGSLPEAVSIWERAVDHYAEGGFFNPAIALCNKILRQSPGRAVVYYKLGKISAEKGFKADARQNFLEYAARMQKSGNLDEAFRALKEFADLVPEQEDVRLMLADQLVKADRKPEALDQLQIAYAQCVRDGRTSDAESVVERMKAIDPSIEPKAGDSGVSSKLGGLVFLDLDPAPTTRSGRLSGLTPAADARRVTKAVAGLELLDTGIPLTPEPARTPQRPAITVPPAPVRPAAEVRPAPMQELVIEPTSMAGAVEGLPAELVAGIPLLDLERIGGTPAAGIPRIDDRPEVEPPTAPSEIPLLDLEPTGATPTGGIPFIDVAPPAAASAETEVPEVAAPVEAHGATDSQGVADPVAAARPSGDFVVFGTPDASPAVEEFGGFEPLEIESSEGVHSLPLGDDYDSASPTLIDAEPASPLPAAAPEAAPEAAPAAVEAPPAPRATSVVLANSVDLLRDRCDAAPEDWGLRRQLAEALLDDGQRDAGVAELESTLAGFERDGDLDTAASVAEEIVRIAPTVIRYHQKRVEFAFRANDRMRLAEAYVELADALVRDGQSAKARVVYQRVLEIAPDDIRAQAALETIAEAPAPAEPAPRRSTTAIKKPAAGASAATTRPASTQPAEDEFISLGDWLRDEEEPKSTRMVVEEKEPTGDEQADFADMLRKFKQGVSDNVDEEDHEAHYDLGVAYKEMGLLDEAISEFQKSLRGPTNRVRAIEALGQCFVEKLQFPVAATILQRALAEPGVTDESLVGVLYLLGTISEELDLFPDAKKFYQRVFAVDIQFRDIGDRLNAVEKRLK